MSDKITVPPCPKCGNKWETTLKQLEKVEIGYRKHDPNKPQKTVSQYRAQCPVCGTYVILDVQED